MSKALQDEVSVAEVTYFEDVTFTKGCFGRLLLFGLRLGQANEYGEYVRITPLVSWFDLLQPHLSQQLSRRVRSTGLWKPKDTFSLNSDHSTL
jgi:hypothetical protein